MGLCQSDASAKADREKQKQIEKQQLKKAKSEDQIYKLLLLGPGESGKSTLFRRLKTLYGDGYTDKDRLTLKSAIFNNTISFIQALVVKVHFYQNLSTLEYL
eukprot:TRINITY_DN8625_c0_g1_i1.p2 TRINITY_DN8625_c0_g1~~TRINITY_DN8625_c0_g1_i1.p2  ORF type:complete len:102 (+),score=12.65 TRINITY_DN8625_c0_g1_i1:290-595(+)